MNPDPPRSDASFELAERKGWCLGDQAAVDTCLGDQGPLAGREAAASGASAPNVGNPKTSGSDCMRELLALQRCLRARTLAERAVRGPQMGSN